MQTAASDSLQTTAAPRPPLEAVPSSAAKLGTFEPKNARPADGPSAQPAPTTVLQGHVAAESVGKDQLQPVPEKGSPQPADPSSGHYIPMTPIRDTVPDGRPGIHAVDPGTTLLKGKVEEVGRPKMSASQHTKPPQHTHPPKNPTPSS